MAEMINAYTITIREPEAKTMLGRARHKWEDNIMINFKKTGCEILEWIQLAQGSG
jgi:hypothetical protein